MPAFAYQALNAQGRPQRGLIEADDRLAALRAVEAKGLVPTEMKEASPQGMLGSRIPVAQVLAFARSLGGLLAAGVPLSRALTVIERESTHPAARAAFARIHARVKDGAMLADAMQGEPGLFAPVFIAMVRAGESGGFLSVVLEQIADYMERSRELTSRVASALIYPILLAVIASAVVCFLLVWFIPKFADLFASFHRELPPITQLIQGASQLLVHYGWILALLGVAAVAGAKYALAAPQGRLGWERLQLRLPGVGTAKATLARVRFCRMLGTLLQSGVPLLAALKVAGEAVGSPVLAGALHGAAEQVRQGAPLTASLSAVGAMLPPTALEALAVAESSGRLPPELLRLADTSEKELDRRLRTLVSLAEPLLLLLMALIVGTIVIGMLMPVFDLWSAIE